MENSQLFSEYFFFRFLINMGSIIILIRYIYYPIHNKRDLFFTFFLLNFVVFLLAFMLEKAKAFNSLGSAFGLLAAFSLLRFRTETISAKDMTYLFIIMAVGIINSIMKGTYWEIMTLNALIIVFVFAVDGNIIMRNQKTKTVDFDDIQNIHPERHDELIRELKSRTGLNIQRISIEHIDLGKKKVAIKLYYL